MNQVTRKRTIPILIILAVLFCTLVIATKPTFAATKISKPVVTIKNIDSEYLQLSWKKCSKAKTYKIYRATSKNGTYKYLSSTSKLSYVDKNVKEGKTYYYKIKATNGKKTQDSNFSTVKSKRFKFEGIIDMPSEITIYGGSNYKEIRINKGNSTEYVVFDHKSLSGNATHLNQLGSGDYKFNGNNIQKTNYYYYDSVLDDMTFYITVHYYKHKDVKKTVKVNVKYVLNAPTYKNCPELPLYEEIFGTSPLKRTTYGEGYEFLNLNGNFSNYLDIIALYGWVQMDHKDLDTKDVYQFQHIYTKRRIIIIEDYSQWKDNNCNTTITISF